jgi:excisionase family DNA binding protein
VSRYLLVEDVAELLGMSKDTVYRLTARDAIPCRRIRGTRRILFVPDELDAWINGAELVVERAAHGGVVVRPVGTGGAS